MNKSTPICLLLLASTLLISCASQEIPEPDPVTEYALSPGVAEIVNSEGSLNLDDRRIVCRQTKFVGSNRIQKICLTDIEMASIRQESQQWVRDAQDYEDVYNSQTLGRVRHSKR